MFFHFPTAVEVASSPPGKELRDRAVQGGAGLPPSHTTGPEGGDSRTMTHIVQYDTPQLSYAHHCTTTVIQYDVHIKLIALSVQ